MSSIFTVSVNRDTSGLFRAVLEDSLGAPVIPAQLSSLTLSLTDRLTGAVINSRNNVSVLNTGGGTLDLLGNFSMTFSAADNPILSTSSPEVEVHVAVFKWTFGTGEAGSHVVQLNVQNINQEEAA